MGIAIATVTEATTAPAAVGIGDFAGLLRRYQSMVYGLALHFLREPAVAEDLAQDVFLQLHQKLREGAGELESEAHVRFWLRKTASHRCIDFARRRQRTPVIPLDAAPEPSQPAPADDPMLSENLRKLVAALPEKARMIVLLRFQEDLDPAEIAQVLEIPVGTVKSQMHRALALLRGKLERTQRSR